jgi:hypothetical protein
MSLINVIIGTFLNMINYKSLQNPYETKFSGYEKSINY